MKKSIFTAAIILLLTVFLFACQAKGNEPLTLTEEDAGTTIELKTGDTLVVTLDGNVTTGFNWIPAEQEPALLEQVGDIEVTPESNAIGAPGKIVLKFKAVASGETTLRLEYKRSWEEGIPPEKTFEVTVVVK